MFGSKHLKKKSVINYVQNLIFFRWVSRCIMTKNKNSGTHTHTHKKIYKLRIIKNENRRGRNMYNLYKLIHERVQIILIDEK